jgi:hypothetical protein
MKQRRSPAGSAEEFSTKLERSNNKLWGCHFRIPGATAERLLTSGSRRVVCRLNEAAEYQCAMIPFGDGSYVITVNKALRAKLAVDPGSVVRVQLTNDASKYGLPMPEEFAELLRQDTEGRRLFGALTAGRKRTLLYIVGKGKTPGIRIARALVIVRHLKANHGTINYRQLHVALQDSRRTITERD